MRYTKDGILYQLVLLKRSVGHSEVTDRWIMKRSDQGWQLQQMNEPDGASLPLGSHWLTAREMYHALVAARNAVYWLANQV